MSSRHTPFIIPIFLQHLGCPHRCLFCNQVPITGASPPFNPSTQSVADEIEAWIARSRSSHHRSVQVAFYGGSFTGLPIDHQHQYLMAVRPFITSGKVNEIRISTRPDYIYPSTPEFLKYFGVTTVEIGVQSMNQDVLDQNLRGHTVNHVTQAISLLKQYSFVIGAQIMIGLPNESNAAAISGAKRLIVLQPNFVRIHPALVIMGSGLARQYHEGSYRPLSMNRAVALSARLTQLFNKHQIPVIRTGLQPSPELEDSIIAGPYHPAFGELVKARLFFNWIRHQLHDHKQRPCKMIIAQQDRSLLTGHGNNSLRRLTQLGLLDRVAIAFEDLGGQRGEIQVRGVA